MNLGAVSIMQFHFGVVIGSQLADQQAAAQRRLLALLRHVDCVEQCPLSGETRKTFAHAECFSV
jgi:hypothetical protein